MKRALQVLCLGLILFLSACGGKTTMIKTTTAKEVTDPNNKTDYNLWYSDDTDTILLSNNCIRIKFDKTNGAIREIYNKTSDIYLIKDIDSLSPITLQTNGHYSDNFITPLDNTFKYNLIANSNTIKTIQMEWKFENDVVAKANVTLEGPSDEIAFEVELSNLDGETSSVQYPIVDQITGISDGGKDDYFLTSFATGYLIENPVRNCNKYGLEFTGEDAIYPMGFGSTMQFMSYFVKDEGGFLLQTKDKSDTIKSFNLRTNGDSISLDIGHFVNDLTKKTEKFKYQTVIKNLYEGNWYEAAEVYKAWAVTQPWCTKNGLNSTRKDLNKDLYENAILCNFIVPATNEQQYADELYMKIRNNLKIEGAKILTIPFYYSITQEVKPGENIKSYFETHANHNFYELLADYGDPIAFFEYTDLHRETSMSILPDYVTSTVMKSYNGTNESITFAEKWYFLCAGNSKWLSTITNRQHQQFAQLKAQGIYNDVGLPAVHPLFCYDDSHDHGTTINVTTDFYNLMEESWNISRSYTVDSDGNKGFTGQEMITEKIIPYVDFYQTRAASGTMGGMEHTHMITTLSAGVSYNIPLFEYIYKEYCGVRCDGFTLPLDEIGLCYYYDIAYTALNGAIPEFNYECIARNRLSGLVNDFSDDMIKFVDNLGKARLTYGKEYLTYASMTRVPNLNQSYQKTAFETPILINWSSVGGRKTGNMYIEPVASCAYRSSDKVAIFLCDVLEEDRTLSFTIDAKELYGIENGTVIIYEDGVERSSYSLVDGKVDLTFSLSSRKVYMIEIK